MSERRLQRSADVVFDVVVDRAILLDGAGEELITLNAVGTVVWNELDGRRDAAELAADLLDRFVDVGFDELRADIAAFLDELAVLGLAVDAPR
ncbi:MAG: PqqD family protein [Ilumatobacteraceae bacterium]